MAPPSSPPVRLPRRLPLRRPPLLAALLGWILPGLGQLYVGRPVKALLYLAAILPTFVVGWWLTDLTIVDPDAYGLDFVAQAFLGGPTLAAVELGAGRVLERMPPHFEVGRLYVQVAGLLNLVAVCDALGDAIWLDRRRDRVARRLGIRRAAVARDLMVPVPPEEAVP